MLPSNTTILRCDFEFVILNSLNSFDGLTPPLGPLTLYQPKIGGISGALS